MMEMKKYDRWAEYLRLFSQQNQMRPTRIGIFEGAPGVMTDFWIEDGLQLKGIDLDTHGADGPAVEIMLGTGENSELTHLTHIIAKTMLVKIVMSTNGEADGLDIEDRQGRTTILRFENWN